MEQTIACIMRGCKNAQERAALNYILQWCYYNGYISKELMDFIDETWRQVMPKMR
jgi:hypothetical protein